MPIFEDHHAAFNAASGYHVTNEEVDIYNTLLGRRRFTRMGGIAGGGEVPLFVMLPRADEVIVVDHSYQSLAACYLKAMLLAAHGMVGAKDLFEDGYSKASKDAVEAIKAEAPASLATYLHGYSSYEGSAIRREWHLAGDRNIKLAAANIHKLRLIHGDLQDLAPFGPFDCLYVSNAHDHGNRHQKSPTLTNYAALVTGRGSLLMTGTLYTADGRDLWKDTKTVKGYRTSWEHRLMTRTPKATVSA